MPGIFSPTSLAALSKPISVVHESPLRKHSGVHRVGFPQCEPSLRVLQLFFLSYLSVF